MSFFFRCLRIAGAVIKLLMQQTRRTIRLIELLPWHLRATRFASGLQIDSHTLDSTRQQASPNPLREYFDRHESGPGIFKWLHYFDAYHSHFAPFINKGPKIMEIGVYSGGSLPMWRHYFGPECHIYGVDIEPVCQTYQNEHTTILIGDQADRSFWSRVRASVPELDILIDDGGHTPEQQLVTLEEMLPHLRPGGIFVCEDVHQSDNAFATYAGGLMSAMHGMQHSALPEGGSGMAVKPNAWQSQIESIHVYPYMLVIKKRDKPLSLFEALRHGTHWQPFMNPSQISANNQS